MAARTIISLALVCGLAACAREPEARTYQLTGQVLAVQRDNNQILVKHEDIPGFMPAMTMAYTVSDAALMNGRVPGDLITATLKVAPERAYLTEIKKTGSAPIPEDASTTIPAAAGVHILQAGDQVPDTALVDQDGTALTLTQFQGFAVALTFIYTRCPLPQYCPLLDRRFAEVQKIVGDDSALRGKVRLVSVSFDPKFDRAETLRAHAQKLKADAATWRFATAEQATVDRFAAAFGVNVIREKDNSITHNMRTAVIDPRGRVVKILDSTEWSADDLARALKDAVH